MSADEPAPPGYKRYDVRGTIFCVPKRYEINYFIGIGAYGAVCSAIDHMATNENHREVAIKKVSNVFTRSHDFQKRILREIKALKHFTHGNIIGLIDLIAPQNYDSFDDVYIVTELMQTDLRYIIKSKQELSDRHIQFFMYQLLKGIKCLHSANVLHRDLKPENLLLNSNCDLKICDFGLCRGLDLGNEDEANHSTPYLATRWYRAPELILWCFKATPAMDVWSAGCIFAELLTGRPLFPGKDPRDQFHLIMQMLGRPSDAEMDFHSEKAKKYIRRMENIDNRTPFHMRFPNAANLAVDLLERMLTFDPRRRITAEAALAHPYLKAFHDPSDEPEAPSFDFSFEVLTDTTSLKDMIYQEVVGFASNTILPWNSAQPPSSSAVSSMHHPSHDSQHHNVDRDMAVSTPLSPMFTEGSPMLSPAYDELTPMDGDTPLPMDEEE